MKRLSITIGEDAEKWQLSYMLERAYKTNQCSNNW